MNILYVEDDKDLSEVVKQKLSSRYSVDVVGNGESALNQVGEKDYELIILDYYLPDKNGIQLCGEMRDSGVKSAILLLTINDAKKSIVEALDNGADDYLTKPFDFEELLARIRSLIRRNEGRKNKEIKVGDIKMDITDGLVWVKNDRFDLPRLEYQMLEYFMINRGRLVTRQSLFEKVWNHGEVYNSNTIDVHVYRLRNKISTLVGKDYIKSVYGLGYRMEEPLN